MRKVRYILSSYVKRGLLDVRVFLLLAGLLIYMQITLKDLIEPLQELHMKVNPFTLMPVLLSSASIYVILFIVYVLWINCLTYHEDEQYELIRMGKKSWYARQCVYCFLTAMLLVLCFIFFMILIYNKHCDFSNTWGNLYEYAKNRREWPGIFFPCDSLASHETLSPYIVSAVYAGLYILLATFLGIIMVILNLRYQKNTGAAVVLLIVMTNRVLSESLSELNRINWFWDNVYPMKLAVPMKRFTMIQQPLWQHAAYGVLYFAVCIGALWIIGQRLIKKVDFSQR